MLRRDFFSIAVLASALAACGGGGTVPDQPPSPIDDFATRYADATCSAMLDCCKTAAFDYDVDACKFASAAHMSDGIYQAIATMKVHFDKAAAERCLTMRVDLYHACKGDGQAEAAACQAILVGEVPVGSPCISTQECAAVPDMVVTCAPDGPNTMKGHCGAAPPTPVPPVGKSGDACSATCLTSPTEGCANVDGAPSAAVCVVSDGLVCDGMSLLCGAVPQIGEACTKFCATGAYCDASGHCQAKTADGPCAAKLDACVDTSICACGDSTCSDPAKMMCVSRGGLKAQCLNDAQCLSAFCYHGFCHVKTPVTEALCYGDL
jgi:hypothetical protein